MDSVLFAVFEFIETLACSEHKKLQKPVATVMNDLVHLLISYMQPTEQQVLDHVIHVLKFSRVSVCIVLCCGL